MNIVAIFDLVETSLIDSYSDVDVVYSTCITVRLQLDKVRIIFHASKLE